MCRASCDLGVKREPTRGLEPLTTCLQDRCAANCATPAGGGRRLCSGLAADMVPGGEGGSTAECGDAQSVKRTCPLAKGS